MAGLPMPWRSPRVGDPIQMPTGNRLLERFAPIYSTRQRALTRAARGPRRFLAEGHLRGGQQDREG
ncbi:hypothetical protein KEM60_00061 [Austwickia sp. TVS 96-490-7B]|nr:hypothetical protein [Austwickia sp. TVS 96-490-7B]